VLASYASSSDLLKPWLELPFTLHLYLPLMTLHEEALEQASNLVGEMCATGIAAV